MKIIALNCLLLLTMLSCTSTGEKNAVTDSVKKEKVIAVSGKFDLANIRFAENIDDLLD